VHTSDQDYEPYYRTLASLDDTSAMEGNCLHAQPGFGRNEMYPCFDSHVNTTLTGNPPPGFDQYITPC
jgi:hypothetical protein